MQHRCRLDLLTALSRKRVVCGGHQGLLELGTGLRLWLGMYPPASNSMPPPPMV